MLTLFNQERATELYGMEMREEGRAEGIGIGRAEGIGIGREEGIVDTYRSLVRKNLLSKETAAKELGISAAEFEKKMAACE